MPYGSVSREIDLRSEAVAPPISQDCAAVRVEIGPEAPESGISQQQLVIR